MTQHHSAHDVRCQEKITLTDIIILWIFLTDSVRHNLSPWKQPSSAPTGIICHEQSFPFERSLYIDYNIVFRCARLIGHWPPGSPFLDWTVHHNLLPTSKHRRCSLVRYSSSTTIMHNNSDLKTTKHKTSLELFDDTREIPWSINHICQRPTIRLFSSRGWLLQCVEGTLTSLSPRLHSILFLSSSSLSSLSSYVCPHYSLFLFLRFLARDKRIALTFNITDSKDNV